MSTNAELAELERELEEVRQDLLKSVEDELDFGDAINVARAESVNFELSYQQREGHNRRMLQLIAQRAAQRRESSRLHGEFQRLQRAVKLARGPAPVVVIPADLAQAMDETMEAA